MEHYQHTQTGWLTIWTLGTGTVLTVGAALHLGSEHLAWIPALVGMVLAVAFLLFYSLTVRLSKDRVEIAFGIGLIRQSFALDDIESVEPVRNHWYYGWGIRYTPHGWLYNVSGFDAVELRLTTGKTYRIGTDEPERLCSAIRDGLVGRQ